MYYIKFGTPAKKDLKRLSRAAQNEIEKIHLPRLQIDARKQGDRLKGEFRAYWKCAFTVGGIAYRIAYEIKEEELLVSVIMIGTRENFYKELKRRLRSS